MEIYRPHEEAKRAKINRTKFHQKLIVAIATCVILFIFAFDFEYFHFNDKGIIPPPLEGVEPNCYSSVKFPDITLLTISTEVVEGYDQCMIKNRRDYADKYGYEFCMYDQKLHRSRSFSWMKFIAVADLFREPAREWIWWLDADALIMNTDIDVASIIEKYPGANVIHTTDLANRTDQSHINAGVFLIRNTAWTFMYLEEIYSKSGMWSSQSDRRATEKWMHEGNAEKYSEKFRVIDYRLMNSLEDTYVDGDFVIHPAGNGPAVPGLWGYFYHAVRKLRYLFTTLKTPSQKYENLLKCCC